jgi:hypothetical protein
MTPKIEASTIFWKNLFRLNRSIPTPPVATRATPGYLVRNANPVALAEMISNDGLDFSKYAANNRSPEKPSKINRGSVIAIA